MNKEKLMSKLIYFGSIIAMCAILILLTYNFFLRTIRIDVMKDIDLIYVGENGNATVSAVNTAEDLNKRTRLFLDSITYTIEPNENLSNGDTIHVTAQYNEAIASQYHFQAVNVEKDFVVESLNYRYETLEDIDRDYLEKIIEETQNYVEDSKNQIWKLNSLSEKATFTSSEVLYKAFMKSDKMDVSDRVLVVYKLIYTVQEEERIIYYTVTVPDINDGNVVSSDIFGEKAYLRENELAEESIETYVQRIYGSQFDIQQIQESEGTVGDEIEEESQK